MSFVLGDARDAGFLETLAVRCSSELPAVSHAAVERMRRELGEHGAGQCAGDDVAGMEGDVDPLGVFQPASRPWPRLAGGVGGGVQR